MTSFDTLQSISSRLNELTNQLSFSKLSKEELEEFETLSRTLYERAVILSYKVKEESVYGESPEETELDELLPFKDDSERKDIKIEDNDSDSETEEIVQQQKIVIEEEPEIEEEEEDTDSQNEPIPVSFDKPDYGEVEFDFTGDFDTPKVEEKPAPKSEPIVDEVKETEEQLEALGEHREEIIKETESIAEEEDTYAKETAQPSLDGMLQGSDDKSASFYERFSKAYKSASGDRLGTSKISSLKGAIGLNDRLQFISELFGGDLNLYNESLDTLDQLENNEVALRKLSEIAAQQSWNKNDSSVDEFAHFVTRRYVD